MINIDNGFKIFNVIMAIVCLICNVIAGFVFLKTNDIISGIFALNYIGYAVYFRLGFSESTKPKEE